MYNCTVYIYDTCTSVALVNIYIIVVFCVPAIANRGIVYMGVVYVLTSVHHASMLVYNITVVLVGRPAVPAGGCRKHSVQAYIPYFVQSCAQSEGFHVVCQLTIIHQSIFVPIEHNPNIDFKASRSPADGKYRPTYCEPRYP